MSESPLFSQLDTDRILQRASEIEGNDEGRSMSIRDLRGITGEAGFGAGAAERAMAEARPTASNRCGPRRPRSHHVADPAKRLMRSRPDLALDQD